MCTYICKYTLTYIHMHTKHGLESHIKKYLLNTSLYQAHMYRFTTNFQGEKLAKLTIKTLKTGQLK